MSTSATTPRSRALLPEIPGRARLASTIFPAGMTQGWTRPRTFRLVGPLGLIMRGFAMGHAIPVRTDYTAGEVRRFAQRAKDAAQARRLLAIAAVLEGASREEAAKIGGMDRQTLR